MISTILTAIRDGIKIGTTIAAGQSSERELGENIIKASVINIIADAGVTILLGSPITLGSLVATGIFTAVGAYVINKFRSWLK